MQLSADEKMQCIEIYPAAEERNVTKANTKKNFYEKNF